jgi:hypothetical protein
VSMALSIHIGLSIQTVAYIHIACVLTIRGVYTDYVGMVNWVVWPFFGIPL